MACRNRRTGRTTTSSRKPPARGHGHPRQPPSRAPSYGRHSFPSFPPRPPSCGRRAGDEICPGDVSCYVCQPRLPARQTNLQPATVTRSPAQCPGSHCRPGVVDHLRGVGVHWSPGRLVRFRDRSTAGPLLLPAGTDRTGHGRPIGELSTG